MEEKSNKEVLGYGKIIQEKKEFCFRGYIPGRFLDGRKLIVMERTSLDLIINYALNQLMKKVEMPEELQLPEMLILNTRKYFLDRTIYASPERESLWIRYEDIEQIIKDENI